MKPMECMIFRQNRNTLPNVCPHGTNLGILPRTRAAADSPDQSGAAAASEVGRHGLFVAKLPQAPKMGLAAAAFVTVDAYRCGHCRCGHARAMAGAKPM